MTLIIALILLTQTNAIPEVYIITIIVWIVHVLFHCTK